MDTPSTSRVLRSATLDHEMSSAEDSDDTYIPSSDNDTSDEDYESDSSESSSSSSDDDAEDADAAYNRARQWTYITTNNILNPSPPPPPRYPFLGNPGLTQHFEGDVDPLYFFELYLDDEIINYITIQTNNFSAKTIENVILSPKSRSQFWVPISSNELRLFLGILILQGLVQKPKSEWYWSNKQLIQTPAFTKLMSQRKFFLIMQYLHFENDEDLLTPHPQPKLKKIWPVFQHFTKKFSEIYLPERDICIDESLMLFKGRLSWTQYMPLKRSRFGIKMFLLCESLSAYIWSVIIYTGKGTIITNNYPDCKMSTKIVMTLMRPLLGLGYCVTLDNYYNSPELGELLLQNKTDFYGTVRPNRKNMPEVKKKDRLKLKVGETIAHQKGKILSLRWHDKKDVHLLSSIHSPEMVEIVKRGQAVKKPRVVVEYNNTMGGVDKMDQQLVCYPTTRKRQKKYYKKLFRQLLDMAVLNSHIIYAKCGGTKSNMDYRLQLVERICEEYHQPRPNNNSAQLRTYTEGNPLRLTERHFPSIVPASAKKKMQVEDVLCVLVKS